MKKMASLFGFVLLQICLLRINGQYLVIDEFGKSATHVQMADISTMLFSGNDLVIIKTDNATMNFDIHGISKLTIQDIVNSIAQPKSVEANIFTIYPNPVNHRLLLHLGVLNSNYVRVFIYNLQGEILKTCNNILPDKNNTVEMNTSALPVGNYLCLILNVDCYQILKFQKNINY